MSTDANHRSPSKINPERKANRSRLLKFKNSIESQILSDATKSLLIRDLKLMVRRELESLFGKVQDCEDNGIVKFMDFKDITDSVLYSYWSVEGEYEKYKPISNDNPLEQVALYRANVFYKGLRWSSPRHTRHFYQLYGILSDAAGRLNPIDEFGKLSLNDPRRRSVVIETNENGFERSKVGRVQMPSLDFLSRNRSAQVRRLAHEITQMRDEARVGPTSNEEFIRYFDRIATKENERFLKATVDLAIKDLLNDKKNDIRGWAAGIREALCAPEVKSAEEIARESDKCLRMMIMFLFYDHPYDIHMFIPGVPKADTLEAENLGAAKSKFLVQRPALFVTRPKGSPIDEPHTEKFLGAAEELSEVPLIEHLIHKKWEDTANNSYVWREEYAKWAPRYQRLISITEDMVKGLCQKHGITVHHLPSRVKEYSSFFNKVASIANGNVYHEKKKQLAAKLRTAKRDGNSVLVKKIESIIGDAERNQREMQSFASFRTKESFKNTVNKLRDFAGARAVCLYVDHVELLGAAFLNQPAPKVQNTETGIGEPKEIVKLRKPEDVVVHDKELGVDSDYRAVHITFDIGNYFTDLPAYEDLRDMRCELQIRTVLSDGYAQAHHDVVYKPTGPLRHLDPEIVENLTRKFVPVARACRKGDEKLSIIYKEFISEKVESEIDNDENK